ncbi:flavin reductase domain protein FMN-binding [Beutenbergia cavernae DSM 12333]|uniref:Flavin reductase domain protein FMN-binding n=1 Tax=Beutenbergia cavernae (strain ATCC BAA-8 / DSM 12333 / CCUG 43141 / JCM 11478 / NBRC 16432 / NCIMB 13614 / HKI 0122) TaxID=471853 RepID=C5C0Y1_BEUC1|nr:flavin reductase family protein [Beutenbergia cavernae]ACQ79385.1 flavin reductase domain protein FMN-binding [Beutenbergia cavernae DSM 12333]
MRPAPEDGDAVPGSVDADAYRDAVARLAGGVAVVTARSGTGVDHAVVTTSVVSASLDPPLVLFVLHADSRVNDLVGVGRTWAVSVVTARAAPAVAWLSEPGRPGLGQLTGIAHHAGAASGAALLDAAAAWVECRTRWVRGAGDHDVVVGDVLAVHLGDGSDGALVHRLGRVLPAP